MAQYTIAIHRPGGRTYNVKAENREEAIEKVAGDIAYHSRKNGLPNVIADGRILIQALNMGECYISRDA